MYSRFPNSALYKHTIKEKLDTDFAFANPFTDVITNMEIFYMKSEEYAMQQNTKIQKLNALCFLNQELLSLPKFL